MLRRRRVIFTGILIVTFLTILIYLKRTGISLKWPIRKSNNKSRNMVQLKNKSIFFLQSKNKSQDIMQSKKNSANIIQSKNESPNIWQLKNNSSNIIQLKNNTQNIMPLKNKSPNIVFLLADDLGWNQVPWHNKEIIAPHLKKLALTGVLLEQSYVQPLCSPSRAALLTGMYPYHLGLQSQAIPILSPTGVPVNFTFLPEHLKELGYSTHAIGKWHLGYCNLAYTPLRRGFDTFYGFYLGKGDYYTHHHVNRDGLNKHGYDFWNQENIDLEANGTYSSELFTSRALKIIKEEAEKNQPMFLYLAYQNIHMPFQVQDRFYNMYQDVKDRNKRIAMGMISAMDESVGAVVEALKMTGIYNNTIIVFTTDNGANGKVIKDANSPLRGNKGDVWEGGTRGVTFVHSPLLLDTPRTYNGLMHITDWHNTLLAAAGCDKLPQNDGFNQWDVLRAGGNISPRKEMIYNIDETRKKSPHSAIRVGDYKYLIGDNGHTKNPQHFLFNITDDPYEERNIASNHPNLVNIMNSHIRAKLLTLVPSHFPRGDPKGKPDNFGGFWSPGWCEAWPTN